MRNWVAKPDSGTWSGRLLIAGIIAVALGLRAWQISGTTLDHFDEGVYAFSALGVSDPGQPHRMYPNQEIFSPPLYFGLGGVVTRVFGVAPDQALLWLSILFGTATVLVVWWVTRSWFGAEAGAAAAVLIALSTYHITFSRSALTDITFTFLFLLALALLVKAVESGSFKFGVWAGLAVGLAWNTKYHGWFALAITGAALLPYTWLSKHRRQSFQRSALVWATAATIAFLTYLPWLIYLRSRPRGSQNMIAHYLGMLRVGWFQNVTRYMEQLFFFETPVSRAAVPIALAIAWLVYRERRQPSARLLVFFTIASGLALIFGASGLAALCAALAIPFFASRDASYRHWVLIGWIALWVVAAPVYEPYARLLLPLAAAGFMMTGFVFSRAITWAQAETARELTKPLRLAAPVLAVAVLAIAFAIPSAASPWRTQRGMQAAALKMTEQIPAGSRVIAVLEPPVAYYLQRTGRAAFERNGSFAVLDTLSTPAYVVTGSLVRRAKRMRNTLAELSPELTPLGAFSIEPYDVRLLDDLNVQRAQSYRAHPDTTFQLRLFRFDPQINK